MELNGDKQPARKRAKKTWLPPTGKGHARAQPQQPQTQILDQYPNLLGDLLSGSNLSVTDFLRDKFRQEYCYIPADHNNDNNNDNKRHVRMEKIVNQLFDLDPESIFEQTASEHIFIWLIEQQQQQQQQQQQDKNAKPAGLIRSIEVNDAETALALYQAGHATYCRAPPALEQLLVPALLANTGLGCGQYENIHNNNNNNNNNTHTLSLGRGEIELFLSPRAGHVTEWHYDFQENFTLQLSGRKQWTLQHSNVISPLSRAVTPHYPFSESVVEGQLLAARLAATNHHHDNDNNNNNNTHHHLLFQFGPPDMDQRHNARRHSDDDDNNNNNESQQVVIMNPGDVLYFPAAMWHKVQVLEPGVSLNISLMATNYAQLTCAALQHLLLQRSSAWRQTILTHHYEHPHPEQQQSPKRMKPVSQNDGNNKAATTTTALDHLQRLLEQDLPWAIQELIHQQGGASAILPPVLRQAPPSFLLLSEPPSPLPLPLPLPLPNSTQNKRIEKDHDDDDDDGEMELDNNDDASSNQESTAVVIVDMDSTRPPCSIDFDPSHEALVEKLKTHRLIRNPLAALMRATDITRYYYHDLQQQQQQQQQQPVSPRDDSEKDGDDNDNGRCLYVLNFNFAGNEAHQSFVRATLSTARHLTDSLDTMFLDEQRADEYSMSLMRDKRWSTKTNGNAHGNSDQQHPSSILAWLIHFGYLVWVTRSL